jgi:hypothetical protein
VDSYLEGLRLFSVFLAQKGMPLVVASLRREHVEAFIAELLANRTPATAHNRYRALHGFFRWCVAEGELKTSPIVDHIEVTRSPITPARNPTTGFRAGGPEPNNLGDSGRDCRARLEDGRTQRPRRLAVEHGVVREVELRRVALQVNY